MRSATSSLWVSLQHQGKFFRSFFRCSCLSEFLNCLKCTHTLEQKKPIMSLDNNNDDDDYYYYYYSTIKSAVNHYLCFEAGEACLWDPIQIGVYYHFFCFGNKIILLLFF